MDENNNTPDLQAQLDALKSEKAKLENDLKAKDEEARKHQRERDRLQAALNAQARRSINLPASQPVAPPKPPTPPVPASAEKVDAQVDESVLNFANEAAKKATLLEEAMKRKLDYDVVKDFEFETPEELRLRLDQILTSRKIAELEEAIKKGAPDRAPKIDTGGRTGTEDVSAKVGSLRDRATTLKKQGKYKEAAWVLLEARHAEGK